jgi:hypothetical protein
MPPLIKSGGLGRIQITPSKHFPRSILGFLNFSPASEEVFEPTINDFLKLITSHSMLNLKEIAFITVKKRKIFITDRLD